MFEAWTDADEGSSGPTDRPNPPSIRAVVVVVRGELDLATAPVLSELLTAHLRAGVTDIELHAAELAFCDATGLTVLDQTEQCLAARGGALRVVDAPPMLRRLLTITNLESLLGTSRGGRARTRHG